MYAYMYTQSCIYAHPPPLYICICTFMATHMTPHLYVTDCLRENEKPNKILLEEGSVQCVLHASAAACPQGTALGDTDIRGGHSLFPALLLPALPPMGSLLSFGNTEQHCKSCLRDAKGCYGYPLPRVSFEQARVKEPVGYLPPCCLCDVGMVSQLGTAKANIKARQPLFN